VVKPEEKNVTEKNGKESKIQEVEIGRKNVEYEMHDYASHK
jgi:hypothetical protein